MSKLAGVIVKLNTIVKICMYKRFHEGHHYIPMAMEVHDAFGCDMDYFIKECACIFCKTIGRSFILVFLHSIF
jgi:hypothetical protein